MRAFTSLLPHRPRRSLGAFLLVVVALVATSCGSADLTIDVETAPSDLTNTLPPGTAPGLESSATRSVPSTTSARLTTEPDVTVAPTTTPPAAVYAMSELAASEPPTSFRMRMSAEIGGFPEFGGGDVVGFSMTAAFSEDGRQGEMEVDMSELIAADPDAVDADLLAAFGEVLAMKYIGDTVYVSAGILSWLAPVDTPWIGMVGDDRATGNSVSMAAVDAGEVLGVLRSLDADAEEVGREEIDGVAVLHIRGTVSAASLAATGNESFLADMDPTGTGLLAADRFDVDVWIGDDGIVRRMEFGVDDLGALDPTAPSGAFFRIVLEISDVGRPVTVTAPPASEVTWLDDLTTGLFVD